MSIAYIINALRKYGIRGVINFFFSRPKEWSYQRFLKGTMKEKHPEKGITLIGCFDQSDSLCKVMRDFVRMLKKANIPYQTLNLSGKSPINMQDFSLFMTAKKDFCLNRFSHIIAMRSPLINFDKRCSIYSIEFWEFEDGFIEGCPHVLRENNILALSNFNQTIFQKILPPPIGVKKVLFPFQFDHGKLLARDQVRSKYNIGLNDFVVFFNFNYASSYFRKNPEGILYAFSKALGNKSNAKIVFKTMNATKCKKMSNRLHCIAKDLGVSEKLITLDDFMPQEDIVNLTNTCDVYMSLHRGEGFGIGIAEAMSLAKPVIVSDYSATTEFCKRDNSILIPCRTVPILLEQLDFDGYKNVSKWAEPDVNVAAEALLRLYNEPALRREIGLQAKKFIESYFSIENFKTSVNNFLDNHSNE